MLVQYDINKVPDFYSVRNFEQIDYAFEGMEGMKCFLFFDNGFESNIIEPNKRNIKFIWDGFIMFVDPVIKLGNMQNGVDLYNARIVALQRTDLFGKKFNGEDVRFYITEKLLEKNIQFNEMDDYNVVKGGYPSKSDLWSSRDGAVVRDAADCTGDGNAYFFYNPNFNFEIKFNKSHIPKFSYIHRGALVLRGENSTAIARLVHNNADLRKKIAKIVGNDRLLSLLEGKDVSGTEIYKLHKL